jgi:hypothetical protein
MVKQAKVDERHGVETKSQHVEILLERSKNNLLVRVPKKSLPATKQVTIDIFSHTLPYLQVAAAVSGNGRHFWGVPCLVFHFVSVLYRAVPLRVSIVDRNNTKFCKLSCIHPGSLKKNI